MFVIGSDKFMWRINYYRGLTLQEVLIMACMNSLSDEVVPYRILRPVVDAVKQVASSRLRLFHGQPVTSDAVGSVA